MRSLGTPGKSTHCPPPALLRKKTLTLLQNKGTNKPTRPLDLTLKKALGHTKSPRNLTGTRGPLVGTTTTTTTPSKAQTPPQPKGIMVTNRDPTTNRPLIIKAKITREPRTPISGNNQRVFPTNPAYQGTTKYQGKMGGGQ